MSHVIKVDPKLEKPPPEAETRLYWVGTLPSSPRQNIVLGGVTFCRALGTLDEKGRFTSMHDGALVSLTEEQVARVKMAAADRIVRRSGTRVNVLTRRAGYQRPKFLPQEKDEPFAQYVYMVDAAEAMKADPAHWRDALPEPMCDPTTAQVNVEHSDGESEFEDDDRDIVR